MRFLFFFLSLSFFSVLTAQNDTINQLNAKGKKQGYWRVLLDSNAMESDSAHALYIAYKYYDNGENLFDFYDHTWKKKDSAVFMGVSPDSPKTVLLNGKFTWYDKKSQMITYEENYENGVPLKFKEIRYKKKKGNYTWAFIRTFNFQKRYYNVPGSYYIQEQNNLAIYNIQEWANFWFRDGKRGWKKYRIKEERGI